MILRNATERELWRELVAAYGHGGWTAAEAAAAADHGVEEAEAAELLADRDHWRAQCLVGLEAYGDAHADIERLEADRDRLAAEVEVLARALLAWKQLGDRGFGVLDRAGS